MAPFPAARVQPDAPIQKAIQSTATSVIAFIGLNNSAAMKYKYKPVASYQEFAAIFGECSDRQIHGEHHLDNYLGYAVHSFFNNGGRKCCIAPVSSMKLEAYQQALKSLEAVADISFVAAPGYNAFAEEHTHEIAQLLVAHCEKMRYRFALLDAAPNTSVQQLLDSRQSIQSTHAAIYAPWPIVYDGRRNNEVAIPPCGVVAGVFARVDMNYGVWASPSNDELRGIIGFERHIDNNEQSELLPGGVNLLRHVTGRGYRLWGTRTTSDDAAWRYIPVRRTGLFVQRSIKQGLTWTVFESNDVSLWQRVEAEVSLFLDKLWLSGAFQGSSADEAYFVRVDRSTMTESDIIGGRLNINVGFAPLRPAEFVTMKICMVTRPGTL